MPWSRRPFVAALCAVALSCTERERPPPFQGGEAGSGGGDGGLLIDAGVGGSRACEPAPTMAICGNQVIPALEDPPNLYFLIDSSGSMEAPLPGSAWTKFENARIAVSVLLDAIGHRVRYGAAVFPAYQNNSNGCMPGLEIFATRRGDPPCYGANEGHGEVLSDLLNQLGFVRLSGGTPLAGSIDALAPNLLALTGNSWVVLITDGAPNCNEAASCGSDGCILNIEGAVIGEQACTADFNCCDPANVGPGGGGSCVDADESERAVADLRAAGISTFVIGMPGSEPYADLLDRLAIAGGTARPEPPWFYSTSDTESLTQALLGIGTGVAISCAIPLAELPPDQDLVNVYFDGRLVAFGEEEGWAWTSEQSLEIRGEACSELRSGTVHQVQIQAGCATIVR